MGNLTISGTTYAAQQQTQTYNVQRAEVKKYSNSIMQDRSGEKNTPVIANDTIIKNDTVHVGISNDTVYMSEEEQNRIERVKNEAHVIVLSMYKAIDGIGTNNKLFEYALSQINSDNILEVIDLWDKTAGKEYNESFIESFLGDANTKQRQVYGERLISELGNRIALEGHDPSKYFPLMETFLYMNSQKNFPPIGAISATFNEILKQFQTDKRNGNNMLKEKVEGWSFA